MAKGDVPIPIYIDGTEERTIVINAALEDCRATVTWPTRIEVVEWVEAYLSRWDELRDRTPPVAAQDETERHHELCASIRSVSDVLEGITKPCDCAAMEDADVDGAARAVHQEHRRQFAGRNYE